MHLMIMVCLFHGHFTELSHSCSVVDFRVWIWLIVPSFSGARSQFSVLKFFKFLAIINFAPPHYCNYCHYWSVQNKEIWIFTTERSSLFFRKCLKCCHSLYYWTTLDSMLFSVLCRQKDLKKGSCADAVRWTLRLLAQAILLGINVLVLL